MKKVVLGLMFFANSVFAMEDDFEIEEFKNELNSYITCFETLHQSIITKPNRDLALDCTSLSSIPSFAEDHFILTELRKYTPKICSYLKGIVVDPGPYLYSDEGLTAQDALRNAIASQVYGEAKKMKEKRQALMNAYSEVISKL